MSTRIRSLNPAHRATTAHVQAIYPFIAESGLGGRGAVIGQEESGGVFCYDPIAYYLRDIIGDPNMAIFGKLSMGKSALVKALLLRLPVFGYRGFVTDVKNEYGPICRFLGGRELVFEPGGGGVRLNPLDARLGGGDVVEEARQKRLEHLYAIVEAAGLNDARRRLTPEEMTGLAVAMGDVGRRYDGQPTLRLVCEAALNPTDEAAHEAGATLEGLRSETRSAALTLKRLVDGDLRGMFDEETTPGLRVGDLPMVSFNVSHLRGLDGLPVAMVCVGAWLQQLLFRPPRRRTMVVFDEAWDVVGLLPVARWMRRAFKLARTWGIACVLVSHTPGDLAAVGAEGSEQVRIATGLLDATSTRVLYRLPEQAVPAAQRLMGLTGPQAARVTQLGRGQALWIVGNRSFVVSHRLGLEEAALIDTDQAMSESEEMEALDEDPVPEAAAEVAG